MPLVPPSLFVCEKCCTRVPYTPQYLDGIERFSPTLCDHCQDQEIQDIVRRKAQHRLNVLQAKWREICPPQYCHIDYKKAPETLLLFLSKLEKWPYGPSGLYLTGESGIGKTLFACALLKKYHLLGHSVDFVNASTLQYYSCSQFDSDREKKRISRQALDRFARHVEILLIDDIGKEAHDTLTKKVSDRFEAELFAILECRYSHGLPVIWTTNDSIYQLREKFSSNRQDPIMRRLVENSKHINDL